MTTLEPYGFAMGYIQVNRRKWCTFICDCLSDYLFRNIFKISLKYFKCKLEFIYLLIYEPNKCFTILCNDEFKKFSKKVISKSFKNPLRN